MICCVVSCGEDDAEDASTRVCVREKSEDDQCAGQSGTPEFYLCESQSHKAPFPDCEPLGETGDLCCPKVADSETDGPDGGDWWRPESGVSWDWQLSEPLDLTHDVAVYDVDWETAASQLDDLKGRGIRLICYVSVGTYEAWRSDADDYPDEIIGPLWPEWDEYFVDIRSDSVREIVARRLDVCADKGFHAVEPDNMDVFELEGDSGFALTEADGLSYAEWLAEQAHSRGLAILQKNASSLTGDLVGLFDGAVTEDCYADDWCDEVADYPKAGKPVFMAEYTDTDVDFEKACAYAAERDFSPILKDRDLTAALSTCP